MATTKKSTTKKKSAKRKATTKKKATAGTKPKRKSKAKKTDPVKDAIVKIQGRKGRREKPEYTKARLIYVTSPEFVTVEQVANYCKLPVKYTQNKATEQHWTVQREIAQREALSEAIQNTYEDLVAFKTKSIERLLWIIDEAEHDLILHVTEKKKAARDEGNEIRTEYIFGEDNARSAVYTLLRAQQQLIGLTKAEEQDDNNPEGTIIYIGDKFAKEVGKLAEAHPTAA